MLPYWTSVLWCFPHSDKILAELNKNYCIWFLPCKQTPAPNIIKYMLSSKAYNDHTEEAVIDKGSVHFNFSRENFSTKIRIMFIAK